MAASFSVVILVYVLKGTGFAASLIVAFLFEAGESLLALAAVPGLLVMWWVTRSYARRRARGARK